MRVEVISPLPGTGARQFERLLRSARPDADVRLVHAERGPSAIESWTENALATAEVVRLAVEAERSGADAVLIYCTADTGLYEARERVDIPVVGLMESAMHLAAMLALNFSVLTFLEETEVRFEQFARRYGLAWALRSVRAIGLPVLALDTDPALTLERLAAQAERAVVEDRAHALVLGCGGFPDAESTISRRLDALGIDVPLIEPSLAGLKMAEALADLGWRQSRRTFPHRPLNQIVGDPVGAR